MTPLRLGVSAAVLLSGFQAALALGQGESGGQSLLQQQRWLQVTLSSGRILLTGQRIGNRGITTRGANESLSVNFMAGGASAKYEYKTNEQQLTVSLENSGEMRIRRVSPGVSPAPLLQFEQRAGQPLLMTLGEGAEQREFRAASLWQLYLDEPELFRKELLPILNRVVVVPWEEMARQILIGVCQPDRLPGREQRDEWSRWIHQLGDDRFVVREAADRNLRATGGHIVPFVKRLDRKHLGAEQRWRLRRIVEQGDAQSGTDTASRVASWIAWDPGLWLILMERDDPAMRLRAHQQLERLLGEKVPFDPTAEASLREAQLEALRQRLVPPLAVSDDE